MHLSRSVYDQMLSRYKRIGQFTYFDIRNTEEDLIIREGVSNKKRKWVSVIAVTATIEENKNSKNEKFVLLINYYINYVTKLK